MIPLKDENSSDTFPIFTIGLILANVLVFIYQISLVSQHIDLTKIFGLRPALLIREPDTLHYSTILASMFLHAGILHLLGNMWFLWIFGKSVENALGHFRFLLFYFLSGIGASIVYIVMNTHSTIPTIGASGAISGILGAYILLFPSARIVTLIPIFFFFQVIRIPAFFFLGIWFVYQFIGGTSDTLHTGGGVAWFAHVGGFLTGMVLVKIIPKRKRFSNSRQPSYE